MLLLPQRYVFSSKSQHLTLWIIIRCRCCCYHKGTYFQANHNLTPLGMIYDKLLLLPQRYVFSSKSQLDEFGNPINPCCCCYHKGTYFQANHNYTIGTVIPTLVVVATTKVRIFKQITTEYVNSLPDDSLLLLPQRYVFSSKSQLLRIF